MPQGAARLLASPESAEVRGGTLDPAGLTRDSRTHLSPPESPRERRLPVLCTAPQWAKAR
jgi:hypothetical protein